MSRMTELRSRLSTLPDTPRRIIYLITEDRNFLEELFTSQADLLKTFSDPVFGHLEDLEPQYMYLRCVEDGYLADIYKKQDPTHKRVELDSYTATDGKKPPFYFLADFHALPEETRASFVKQFIYYARQREREAKPAYLFLLSPVLKLPIGFDQEIEVLDVPEMDSEDTENLLLRTAREFRPAGSKPLDDTALYRIRQAAEDLKGISRWEMLDILRYLQDAEGSFFGESTHKMEKVNDIRVLRQRLVKEQKQRSAMRDSTITLREPQNSVKGMELFLEWLDEIKDDLTHPDDARAWASDSPRGVLLSGLPGTGKTQAAKQAAHDMGVPLVQFRMDNLLGGRVGDSEANFKRCRKRVEALAPCVVLIDEIEKIFDTKKSSDSNSVRMNLLAALLDWLQENDNQIFFFATCNSVSALPDELQRDGRFDQRYCAFMPTHSELAGIIVFHLDKANALSGDQRLKNISSEYALVAEDFLNRITELTKNGRNMFYTGANIEALIKKTNLLMRKKFRQGKGDFEKYEFPNRSVYVDLMVETARGATSQPYGESNMSTIVHFWLSALENQYTFASRNPSIPFNAFNKDTGKFNREKLPKFQNPDSYDALMQKRIVDAIEAHLRQRPKQ